MKLQPDLLLHPNVPKPLHGTAPRILKGQIWWNKQRKVAYEANNFCCWACGVHKSKAKYNQWLEAHEIYKIDYSIGKVKFNGICALCPSCHSFIHSGRLLSLYEKGEVPFQKIRNILIHGFEVLREAKLPMNPFAMKVAKEVEQGLFNKYIKFGVHDYGMCLAEWDDWYMIVDGKQYKGKFKNYKEWEQYYK